MKLKYRIQSNENFFNNVGKGKSIVFIQIADKEVQNFHS